MGDNLMVFGIFFLLGFNLYLAKEVFKISKQINEILIRQRHIHDGLEILMKSFVKVAGEKK